VPLELVVDPTLAPDALAPAVVVPLLELSEPLVEVELPLVDLLFLRASSSLILAHGKVSRYSRRARRIEERTGTSFNIVTQLLMPS